jgi:hypothetical protein
MVARAIAADIGVGEGDQSGTVKLVMWGSACQQLYGRIMVGDVIFITEFAVVNYVCAGSGGETSDCNRCTRATIERAGTQIDPSSVLIEW